MSRFLPLMIVALAAILLFSAPAPAHATEIMQAETMTPSGSGVGAVQYDATASGGEYFLLWSDGHIYKDFHVTSDSGKFVVSARGDYCDAWPIMTVNIDGVQVYSDYVRSSTWTGVPIRKALVKNQTYRISIRFDNDYATASCDRNLRVDSVSFEVANVFQDEAIYVPPNNRARQTADQWRSEGRTADANQMEKIARTGTSLWIPEDNPYNVTNNYVTAARDAGQLPVVTLYDIPARDCGSYSGGGASSAESYRSYVDAISAGIGARKAAVVVEPDALAQLTQCLDSVGQQERLDLIKYAVDTFETNNTATGVYIDAGHPQWHPASTMIDRLKLAGIEKADGFSLNVSNFVSTAENISYGKEISAGVGGKHFIIDTGRNGNGPYTGGTHSGDCPSWANAPGRALGERAGYVKPTDPLVDSYVWIKPPGESDANCGGYPPAGGWVPEYALELANNATWPPPDTTAPTVIDDSSLEPDRGATGVSHTTDVSATFSEEMMPESLTPTTFKLQMYDRQSKKWMTIPATISLSNGNKTAMLDPFGSTETGTTENPLAANKKFRGLITTGATDLAGNPLAGRFVWAFETGGG